MSDERLILDPNDILRVKIFEDVSINSRGYVLFSMTSFDPNDSPKVMVYDMISVLRDSLGIQPKWGPRDVYFYLQGTNLMMKRVGYIDEKEVAKNVIDYDVSKGQLAIVQYEKKKPKRDFITEKIAIMEEFNIGPLYEESIPKKIVKTRNFQDEGWITNLAISENGKLAYAKVLDISPIKQGLFIDGDKILEIIGFIGEIKWINDKIAVRTTNLEERGFFSKKELLIVEENGDFTKVDVPGDPGDWVEVYPAPSGDTIAYQNGKLYFISTEAYRSVVRELDLSSMSHRVLISGDRSIHAISTSSYGLAFIWSSPTRSSVVSVYRWKDSKEMEIASGSRVPEVKVSVVDERHLILGENEKKILMIHGGPRTCYGLSFNFEALLYAFNGYEVHMINYPGSAGFEDDVNVELIIRSITDYVKKVKGEKVIFGESFGAPLAFTVGAIVDNLSGVIVERGIYESISGLLTSDEGIEFEKLTYKLGDPMDHPEEFIKYSPLFLIKDIKSPVLVIGATEDWRTPFSQSVMLYNALKRYGKEACFLILFGDHNIKYSGESREKVVRLSKILEWIKNVLEKT